MVVYSSSTELYGNVTTPSGPVPRTHKKHEHVTLSTSVEHAHLVLKDGHPAAIQRTGEKILAFAPRKIRRDGPLIFVSRLARVVEKQRAHRTHTAETSLFLLLLSNAWHDFM